MTRQGDVRVSVHGIHMSRRLENKARHKSRHIMSRANVSDTLVRVLSRCVPAEAATSLLALCIRAFEAKQRHTEANNADFQ